ncbi:RNA 3'-terminal phosphate cyclase [Pseudomonas syringae pv. actinidiae]|uniref:RNA 3'-terminal phosphate cyclase n=1 Tax=Pseudomonas syringae pv. actinidiae TaxID=103796 RepID=A0AAN4QCQ7_PSESF|nr:RNA 3'-terminal phosphate cyclase [Pseudomonas syringae pv. actinidiae]
MAESGLFLRPRTRLLMAEYSQDTFVHFECRSWPFLMARLNQRKALEADNHHRGRHPSGHADLVNGYSPPAHRIRNTDGDPSRSRHSAPSGLDRLHGTHIDFHDS